MDPGLAARQEARQLLGALPLLKGAPLDSALETPKERDNGDLACNIAFSLARQLKKAPQEIAKELAGALHLPRGSNFEKIETAGGYINFFYDYATIGNAVLDGVAKAKQAYGKGRKTGQKLMVEYFHANTHKAVHIGHVRNIALGESLCRILSFAGNDVVRVNYQGDIGPHVSKCVWAYLNFFKGQEPSGVKERGRWLGEVYRQANAQLASNAAYETDVAEIDRQIYARQGEAAKVWQQTRQWSLDYFETIYKDFGVKYRRLYFESEVEGPGRKISKRLLTEGVAQESEGAIIVDLEKHGLGIFLILKTGGLPLYSNKELALAELQDQEHKPNRIIHVVGSEQRLHFQQAFKTLELFRPDIAAKEFHLSYELVNLPTGKMKSREGKVILYEDLKEQLVGVAMGLTRQKNQALANQEIAGIAEQVALGALKYAMIAQSPDKAIIFDWDRSLDISGDSAPYLQYSYARAKAILRKAGVDSAGKFDATLLQQPAEKALVSRLAEFPQLVQKAARDLRPHYLANYCHTLAAAFNDFYEQHQVLNATPGEKALRLALVAAFVQVLENGLELLGIGAMERM